MAVVFIKGLSKDEIKDLKRLKVELDAETWKELLLTLASSNLSTLPKPVENPSMSKRWETATNFFTMAITMYCDVIKRQVNFEEYLKIQIEIWGEIGKRVGEAFKCYFEADEADARKAHTSMRMISKVIMGPELRFEFVEGTREKSVMRITQCPWHSIMMETGIQSFCEPYHEAHEALCQGILSSISPRYRFHFTDHTTSQSFHYCDEVVELLD